jgi:hypothetical protein
MSFLKIAVIVFGVVFGTANAPGFHQLGFGQAAPPRPTSWRGSTGDLSVDLKFEQFRDSIYARGTYKVGPKKRVGCGGETLSPSGYLTMRAKGSLASFRGKFLFDSGWTPPVSGRQNGKGAIKVTIRSVDRGPCVMTLEKWAKVSGSP